MTELIALALGGIPLGAMYALQAMGIVLVYKTSGVFNFAQGAIGMMAAFIASSLALSYGLPMPVALVGALAFGALTGVVMERLTIRPVEGTLQRTVVTLGWLLGLQGLAQVLFGQGAGRGFLTVFPQTLAFRIDGLAVGFSVDQLGVVAVALGVAGGLAAFFRRSSFGISMRAVADAPEAAGLLGVDVGRVTLVSWALGAGLAALSGVLVTPLLATLDTVGLIIFTIQALAAALIGRLTSLPRTLVGGLALGMAQPVIGRVLSLGAGANELIAFAFILGALLLRRRTGRGDSGAGGLAPVPLRPLPRGRAAALAAAGIGVGLLVQGTVLDPGVTSRSVAVTAIWGLAVLSLTLLGGVAGQVSLCQGVFMGVGGYGAAIAVGAGVPFVPALVLGATLAALVAAVVGLPALRLRGLELAIVTLSLAFAADRYIFTSLTPLVGPDRRRPLPRPEWLNPRITTVDAGGQALEITDWRPYALLALVLFLLAAWGVASLRRGRTGAAFTALRSSEAATSAMGFSVVAVKLKGFALSGFLAGLGGAAFAGLGQLAGATAFGFDRSITLLAYAVIVGLGSVPGAFLGGLIVTLSTLSFGGDQGAVATDAGALVTVATAVVLVVVLRVAPQGLAGLAADVRTRVARAGRRRGPSAELAAEGVAS
ncbi:MAG: ABC transporter permease [Actinomycetes bacterium]